MPSNKPVETENRDRIDEHRREIEGKFRWAVGLAIPLLILVFGTLWHRMDKLEDRIFALEAKVSPMETRMNEHWKN